MNDKDIRVALINAGTLPFAERVPPSCKRDADPGLLVGSGSGSSLWTVRNPDPDSGSSSLNLYFLCLYVLNKIYFLS